MKLWHDDIRKAPEGWEWARTNEEAQTLLQSGEVDECSLDHDMGLHELDPDADGAVFRRGQAEENGTDLVQWMVANDLVPAKVVIHSWNPPGAVRMRQILQDAGHHSLIAPYEVGQNVDPF